MDTSKFKSVPLEASEVTPESVYNSRRHFLKAMGMLGAGALLAACAPQGAEETAATSETAATAAPAGIQTQANVDELGQELNTYEEIANYNNYYEFTTNKQQVAALAEDFQTSPWDVEVYGMVEQPKTYAVEDLLAKFEQEERIYRMRCVEGWSMVIPWMGFPLAKLLEEVKPLDSAKYVRFETLMDSERMPGQKARSYPWPYQEGLRLDEAKHDLTILASGLYGKPMPNSTGAPLRLVVPWKYGFKSIKAIVKIELVDEEPATLWSTIAPREYGFYSNVNPEVAHPRWSQSSERRIGENGRRPTLMFNGYADEVAHLYEGMDLSKYY